MAAAGLCPGAQDIGEVMHVVRDHDASLLLGDREQDRIVELLQLVDKPGGDNVVPALCQKPQQRVARQVGVEKEAEWLTIRL